MGNGIRIHYWRTGGAKPVMVMAHGFSDDGLCWTSFAKEFEDRYDIILMDARGHGLSDAPGAQDSIDSMVEDLAALIRELKLEKPVLVGHSMGSATVAGFAAKYPDVPRAVVLEDPGLGQMPPGGMRRDPEKMRADIIARNNTSEKDLVAQCMKDTPKWGAAECEIWAPSKRRLHPNVANILGGVRTPMKEQFTHITVPTLILKADAKPDARKQNEEVTAVLKQGKIVHIDGAGHNVRREGKAQSVAVMNEFLAGLK
jgi:pimeloyl-ACP methyl ester carboxylesterase